MKRVKAKKIVLTGYGSYLGMEKGCFLLKDKDGEEDRFPLFEEEIGEVVLKSGNAVSVGALASLGFWGIDCMVLTRKGRPVAMLKALDDDSHVKTRLAQYEAYNSEKAFQIAKQFVLARIKGQNEILEKHNLQTHNPILEQVLEGIEATELKTFRQKLTGIEGKCSENYFRQIFRLLPAQLRPKGRKKFRAYDGMNNIFNLAYEMLSWKVHRALIKAKLEPFLGFLHSTQHGKPSLTCDFVELYRYLVEDFLIQQCQGYRKKDFIFKTEVVKGNKIAKRQYLNNLRTRELMKKLNVFFEKKVKVPRIYIGKRQTIETLINEEAQIFAMYLRGKGEIWNPRIAIP